MSDIQAVLILFGKCVGVKCIFQRYLLQIRFISLLGSFLCCVKKYQPVIVQVKWILLSWHGASSGCGWRYPPDRQYTHLMQHILNMYSPHMTCILERFRCILLLIKTPLFTYVQKSLIFHMRTQYCIRMKTRQVHNFSLFRYRNFQTILFLPAAVVKTFFVSSLLLSKAESTLRQIYLTNWLYVSRLEEI